MNTLGAREMTNREAGSYATGGDFCRIFQQDMDRLYLLSLLLTGDASRADKCFMRGLEDTGKGNPVFKEWARSWARRTITQKAIEMMQPRPNGDTSTVQASAAEHAGTGRQEIARVLALPPFERFVFVMSVLEGISDQECSLLLDCTRGEAAAARIRALQQIGTLPQLHGEDVTANAERKDCRDRHRSAPHLQAVSQLPVSA